MFNWFRKKQTSNQRFIEDIHEERTARDVAETTPDVTSDIQSSLTYFTVNGGGGSIFLNAVLEANEDAVKAMVRVLISSFSPKVQAKTIQTIRENLIKSERPDLLNVFNTELITASIKQTNFNNTESGEEEPCVSPSDMMT